MDILIPSLLTVCLAVCFAVPALPANADDSSTGPRPAHVWRPLGITLRASRMYANPFMEVEVEATFTGPDSDSMTIPGFHTGGRGWTVRFSPTRPGRWTWTTRSSDSAMDGLTGQIDAAPNPNPDIHGPVRVHPDYPHHFRYEDGAPFFLMGYECDWLGLMDLDRPQPDRAEKVIRMYADHGFNQVFMNVYAHDTLWRQGTTGPQDFGPPKLYAWEGSNEQPDHTRLNTHFFEQFDKVIELLYQHGTQAHLFFKVYNKLVNWPERLSPEEDLYFSYVAARYQAYPNIIWDFSKETYNEPDHAYIRNRMDLIRRLDAYHHLLTTHDSDRFYSEEESRALMDFHTDQNHDNWHGTILAQRSQHPWPVHNAEYGYEWGPGGPEDKTFGNVQSPEEVLWRTCEVLMAGGYPAYYYTNHAWDIIKWDETPRGLPWYRTLAGFFRSTNWFRLQPSDHLLQDGVGARCLAESGKEYIVFFTPGSKATLSLAPPANWSARWVNIYSGEEHTDTALGHSRELQPPWPDAPAMLHLTRDR